MPYTKYRFVSGERVEVKTKSGHQAGKVLKAASGKAEGSYYIELDNGLCQLFSESNMRKVESPNPSKAGRPKVEKPKERNRPDYLTPVDDMDIGLNWWENEPTKSEDLKLLDRNTTWGKLDNSNPGIGKIHLPELD
jgi:hypothetical protein